MYIGILDLIHDRPPTGIADPYGLIFRKQLMSIMPQCIAVWCREMGHKTHYRTYWGQADPISLMPDDLDVLFVSCYTQSSALAYAIASVYRRRGALTVLGGSHARCFPTDCARFFDIVVKDCDRSLISDILRKRYDPPAIISSNRPLTQFPTVEERLPEIKISAFYKGWPTPVSTVPLLSSIGCPYNCGFCVDWNSDYIIRPGDELYEDLKYLSLHYPKTLIAYHDPNFGVRFDNTMNIITRLPAGKRNRYVMESSLSILKAERLPRLLESNCRYVAPGIESWTEYSNKAGTGLLVGEHKLDKIVNHLNLLKNYVGGVQANFIFGADSDYGADPVRLTKEFMQRMPEVWPTINIPIAFGGTPFYDELHRSGRIIETMPFFFYYNPYLTITTRNYEPLEFYDHLIDLNALRASILFQRLAAQSPSSIRFINTLRTIQARSELGEFRRVRSMLASDAQFRAYHMGRARDLPAFYSRLFERHLGPYAELLPPPLRQPILEAPGGIRPAPLRSRTHDAATSAHRLDRKSSRERTPIEPLT